MWRMQHRLPWIWLWRTGGLCFFWILSCPFLLLGQEQTQWCSPPYLVEWPDDDPVWSFCWTPPAFSSGINGSGIEISHAFYQGRRVFWKAHVPIQRVHYAGNACGPYRDWHDQEHPFQCSGVPDGTSKACFGTATTICDGLPDGNGNFTGVVIDKRADEVVLTSVMRAGWYRYVQKWHFYQDGTIAPRFHMTGAAHACTNYDHTHHVYWRFDFDINEAPYDAVQRQVKGSWRMLKDETSDVKHSGLAHQWRVLDLEIGSGFALTPGPTDGLADAFSKADLWALRFRAGEIGDEATAYDDRLDLYLNKERIRRENVVVWYAGHGFHPGRHFECHAVGPDLRHQPAKGGSPLP